jgi:hypothetical protein
MTVIDKILRRTKQLFSGLFQSWCIDEETEKISKNQSQSEVSIYYQASPRTKRRGYIK